MSSQSCLQCHLNLNVVLNVMYISMSPGRWKQEAATNHPNMQTLLAIGCCMRQLASFDKVGTSRAQSYLDIQKHKSSPNVQCNTVVEVIS